MPDVVVFNRTGGPDVLEIVSADVPAPAPDEVQIRVRALGLNRAEAMYRAGAYLIEPEYPARLGYEAAGVVEAVGKNVADITRGDAVSVIPAFAFSEYGLYGELVNAPARAVVRHPTNLSFEEAAASWMMFVTAWGALIELGQLSEGQNVVIRAASSSVGIAAIQIANLVGARPVALTRTGVKRAFLLNAGAAAVVETEEKDVLSAVREATAGEGAHIVFDPVGGPGAAELIRAMATGGTYFQYGALDARDLSVPVMDLLGRHLTLRGYELFEITLDDEKLVRAKTFITDGLSTGALRPLIDRIFSFADIAEAHRYLEANGQAGKIIVKI